jgi:hypothetical protein
MSCHLSGVHATAAAGPTCHFPWPVVSWLDHVSKERTRIDQLLSATERCLNLRPLPHGQGSLRRMLGMGRGEAL